MILSISMLQEPHNSITQDREIIKQKLLEKELIPSNQSYHCNANHFKCLLVSWVCTPSPYTAFNYFAYYCVVVVVRQKQGRTHYTSRDEEPESVATGAAEGTWYLLQMKYKLRETKSTESLERREYHINLLESSFNVSYFKFCTVIILGREKLMTT